MCGISGIVTVGGTAGRAERAGDVERMVAALRHRGPDSIGFSGDTRADLGIARLAIRGLRTELQPLQDPASGVIALCNGEIDNHRALRAWLAERGREAPTDSDVGVLPGLYLELGPAFVERLAGPFAIAVWDPRDATLLLARDRAGERSLFFLARDGEIRFASELSALAAIDTAGLSPDDVTLRSYLRTGHFADGAAPMAGVARVGPAEVVTFDGTMPVRRRYWRWSHAASPAETPSTDAFDPVFTRAVARQSDVDVDYGIFLSGGVDSSLVAAVAAAVRPEVRPTAYTLRFAEDSYDEGSWAVQVADMLGLEAVSVDVTAEAFPDALADLIAHCGEPLADPAWIPTAMLARRAARDVKVALVGEGADELFGGYPTYIGALTAARYNRVPRVLRAVFERIVAAWPVSDKKVALSFLVKRFVEAAGLDPLSRHAAWTAAVPPAIQRRLGLPPADEMAGPELTAPADILDAVQRHDFEHMLAEGLLTKADRAAMRWGLETRAPFLDPDVIAFAGILPARARVDGVRTKVFLKRYARRYLPDAIVDRRKRGLSVPLGPWLRGPLRDWATALLAAPGLADIGIARSAALALLDEHIAGRADHARPLWALIVLAQWLEWRARQARPADTASVRAMAARS